MRGSPSWISTRSTLGSVSSASTLVMKLSVLLSTPSRLELDELRTQRLARFVMDRMRVHPLAELCVTAVDEDTIAELNAKWMDKEGPTDVLAFPMDELRPGMVNDEPEEGVLGDLVLCPSWLRARRRRPGTR